ncbi:ABC transporter substrate-binding protein [Salinibacterium sp. ZJ454]|uniref:ABC transporter substrate-binding protein n=1 Tax=Salinibacterium sp. ZJ454 TaxID=2708339 RepID=UPI001422099D|nr:ABC transporter substrate-binding protein [Salinibacterium sp. ZJ454]
MPKFRMIAASAAAVVTIGLAGCATNPTEPGNAPAAAEMDHVTIQLDFSPRGLHSVFYVADQLGFFEDENIIIDDILPGAGSGDTLRLVGQGQGDFGSADLPTLVVARSQGVEVTALNAINQNSPLAMCTKADRFKLDTPADLKGLNVGVQANGSTYIFYKALLAANGMSQDDLTEFTVKPPYESYLLTDQVDTVPCYIDAEIPILEEHAGGEGSLSIMLGSDWGYDAYGTGVFTSQKMIDENPELVQRFMNAYTAAFEYVTKNPEEAAEVLAGTSPEFAKNVDLYITQLGVDISSSFVSEDTEANGLGSMTAKKWQATIDMLADQKVIETIPATKDVYDSTFVDAATK